MLVKTQGEQVADAGIYLYSTFWPLRFDRLEIPDAQTPLKRGLDLRELDAYRWYVVLYVLESAWQGKSIFRTREAGLVFFALLALIGLTAASMARLGANREHLLALERTRACQFEDLYENAPFGYLSVLPDGRVVRVNETCLGWIGYGREEVLACKVEDLVAEDSQEAVRGFILEVSGSKKRHDLDASLKRKDGSNFRVHLSASPVIESWGDVAMIRIAAEDIEERYRLSRELQRLATIDGLTGVFNRRALMELAEREWMRAERLGSPLSVLLLDIDHFKHINDCHGHAAGDAALVALADLCGTALRASDIFGRYGGEEFLVILPDADLETSIEVAERLNKVFDGRLLPYGSDKSLSITVSIGVAAKNEATASLEEVIQNADEQLYCAKKEGRNRVCSARANFLNDG